MSKPDSSISRKETTEKGRAETGENILRRADADQLSLESLLDHIIDDQRARSSDKIPPSAEQYLARFPQLRQNEDYVLDIIYNEFLLCHQESSAPAAVEGYVQRFPELADKLKRQLKFLLGVNAFGSSSASSPKSDVSDFPNDEPTGLADDLKLVADRFEIYKKLGGGGFSNVYEAWDHKLKRRIAIKIAKAHIQVGTNAYHRFAREAESTARLNHPGIVQFYEFGVHDDRPIIIVQLIEGGTLHDRIDDIHRTSRQTAKWIWEVCLALDYAHQLGVVHRDIKPANIMLDREKRAKLTDFGLASLMESELTITQQGDLLGTPAYMSPEQASGKEIIGPASDVYSLGAVLYHLLCRRLPFEGTSSSVLFQTQNDEPVAPRKLDRSISLDLQTICLKAMAKNPNSRYSSAAKMGDDLYRYLNRVPIKARPVGPIEKAWRWCHRNPALAATVLISMVLLSIISITGFNRITEERDRFREQRDKANLNLFDSLVNNARSDLRSKPTGWYERAIESLNQAAILDVSSRDTTELRELMIEALATTTPRFRLDAMSTGAKFGIGQAVPSRVVSVTGETATGIFVAGFSDGSLKVINGEMSFSLAELTGPGKTVTGIQILPDSSVVFGLADGKLWRWDISKLAGSTSPPDRPQTIVGEIVESTGVVAISVSPNGELLAVASEDNPVRIFSLHDGKPGGVAVELDTNDVAIRCMNFSRDSRELVVGLADLRLCRWSAINGILVDSRVLLVDEAYSLDANQQLIAWTDRTSFKFETWSRDGVHSYSGLLPGHVVRIELLAGFVLYGCDDGTIGISSQRNPSETIASASASGELTALAIGHDHKSVITGYIDGTLRNWSLETSEFARPVGLQHALVTGPGNEFLSDNRRIGELDAPLPRVTHLEQGVVFAMAVNEKRNLLVCGRDRNLILVDLESGEQRKVLSGHQPSIAHVAFSPDGNWIATADESDQIHIWQNEGEVPVIRHVLAAANLLQLKLNDNRLIATTSTKIVAFDLVDGSETVVADIPQTAGALAIYDDLVAWSNPDNEIELRNLDGERVGLFRGHSNHVMQLEFADDGNKLLSLALDSTLREWDVASGNETRQLSMPGRQSRFCLDPLGKFVVVVEDDRFRVVLARLIDYQTGELIGSFASAWRPHDIAFQPDGSRFWLAMGGVMEYDRNDLMTAYNNRSTARDRQLNFDIPYPYCHIVPGGHHSGRWSASISPDGKWLASTGHAHNVVLRTGDDFHIDRVLTGHNDVVWSSAFNTDGTILATGSGLEERGEIIFWDTSSWEVKERIYLSEQVITGLCFHPHLPLLAACSFDGRAWLLHSETGAVLKQLLPAGSKTMEVVFSPDGKYLVAARTSNGLSVWSINDSESDPVALETEFNDPDEQFWTVQFTNDGRTLAVGTESGLIQLFRFPDCQSLVKFRTSSLTIRRIAFTKDGRFMAFGAYTTNDGQVWDLKTLRENLRKSNLDW